MVEICFLTIDDYNKIVTVYSIKSKDEFYNVFDKYINLVENMTGKSVKKVKRLFRSRD